MAAIEKIYGTCEQWIDLHHWVATSKRPQYCQYFYPTPAWDKEGPIVNFPKRVDSWIYKNCPFKWVKKRIKEQYNGRVP